MARYSVFRQVHKVVSWFVIVTFLASNPAFAASRDVFAVDQSAKSGTKKGSPTAIEDIVVPEDIGLVKDSFEGNGKRLVIHIQDAHCNYEAQSNIARLLDMFMDNKGLVLIALEGSAGEIDTSLFTTFPDEEIRKEVATYFMKKGKISGAEYLAINTKKPVMLYGIENKEYYLENLKAFTDSLANRDAAKTFCRDVRSYLNRLKRYIYNKELKELDRAINEYNDDKIKFVDFCIYLDGLATQKRVNLAPYPNFAHLMRALAIEKEIDFKKVDNERSTVISELEKKLSQDDLSDLLLKSLSYKTKKISASDYYTYLKGLALRANIKFGTFKNFNRYVDYLTTYATIDNPVLFKELTNLQEDIKEGLYTNNDQRTLNRLSKNIRIMNDLLDIALSKEEAVYVTEHIKEFTSDSFISFIRRQSSKYGMAFSMNNGGDVIDEVMPSLGKFYQIAEKREDALLENTLTKMDDEGFVVSVLISGGYHTEGLTKRFKERGISYVVIAPRITDLEAESPYLEILSGGKTTIEKVVAGEE
jgi:hypothetical protein